MKEKEAFYDILNTTFNKIHKKDITILMGDMNAQIGSNNTDLEKIMGRHALGYMTKNGVLRLT